MGPQPRVYVVIYVYICMNQLGPNRHQQQRLSRLILWSTSATQTQFYIRNITIFSTSVALMSLMSSSSLLFYYILFYRFFCFLFLPHTYFLSPPLLRLFHSYICAF